MIITHQFIEDGMSGKGGWTAEQLSLLGISWPPSKGWKHMVVGSRIDDSCARKFLELGEERKSMKSQREAKKSMNAVSDERIQGDIMSWMPRVSQKRSKLEEAKRRKDEIALRMEAVRAKHQYDQLKKDLDQMIGGKDSD